MFNAILKKVVPIPKLTAFDNYLFVGPHPDDIEMGCAPTVAKLVKMGKKVTFLICTDGCVGTTDKELCGEKLAAIRKQEAKDSAKILGVTDVRFLPFHDGGMYSTEELAQQISKVAVEVEAQIIFAPDPTVASECHFDHLKAGYASGFSLTLSAFPYAMMQIGVDKTQSVKAIAYYYTDKANSYFPIGDTFELRRKALECHKTQFDKEMLDRIAPYLKLRSIGFGLRKFRGKCDGYRVLSDTHAHCFPEASD